MWQATRDDSSFFKLLSAVVLVRLIAAANGVLRNWNKWIVEWAELGGLAAARSHLDGMGIQICGDCVSLYLSTESGGVLMGSDLDFLESSVCNHWEATNGDSSIDFRGIVLRMVHSYEEALAVLRPELLREFAAAPATGTISKLSEIDVLYSKMHEDCPDFMVQYECCWTVIPSKQRASLVLPNLNSLPEPHRAHISKSYGYKTVEHWTACKVASALDCFAVPCHELTHLIQTATGQIDTDSLSYSAEHDASRLCGVMSIQSFKHATTAIRVLPRSQPATQPRAATEPAAAATGPGAATEPAAAATEPGAATEPAAAATEADATTAEPDATAAAAATSSGGKGDDIPEPWEVPAYLPALCALSMLAVAPLSLARLQSLASHPGPDAMDKARAATLMRQAADTGTHPAREALAAAKSMATAAMGAVASAEGAAMGAVASAPGSTVAPATTGLLLSLEPAYRSWTASYGMWSPTKLLRELGCKNLHDRAFKDLVCAEGIHNAGDDAFVSRLLEATFLHRTGDLRSEANLARVSAMLAERPGLAVTASAWDDIMATVDPPTSLLAALPTVMRV
jgi:hypothetical protein